MKRINSKIKNFFGLGDAGFSFMTTVETSFFLIFLNRRRDPATGLGGYYFNLDRCLRHGFRHCCRSYR